MMPAPTAVVRVLSLEECLHLALEQQPNIAAARASLAASEAQKKALEDLHLPPIVGPGRELPIRRKQANLGITISQAGVNLAERDTAYSVARTYFASVYARRQQEVAAQVVRDLGDALANARRLLKGGAPNVTQNDVDKTEAYLRLAEARQNDAIRGLALATAALREAIGLAPDCCFQPAYIDLPATGRQICRDEIIALALAHRDELTQAISVAQVVDLEVDAQGTSCLPSHHTFALVVDLHARPIPQGANNTEYRPAALGIEMPPTLVGKRADRIERAHAFSSRAAAVVDKTRNLIALEAEDAYLKWEEASRKAGLTHRAAELSRKLAKDNLNDFKGGQAVVYRDVLEAVILAAQARAQENEALYQHALGLAALERVTGGAFCAGFGFPSAALPPK
jgi:outer membrane protein TolC